MIKDDLLTSVLATIKWWNQKNEITLLYLLDICHNKVPFFKIWPLEGQNLFFLLFFGGIENKKKIFSDLLTLSREIPWEFHILKCNVVLGLKPKVLNRIHILVQRSFFISATIGSPSGWWWDGDFCSRHLKRIEKSELKYKVLLFYLIRLITYYRTSHRYWDTYQPDISS